jgi:hypothetical protein
MPSVEHGLVVEDEQTAEHEFMGLFSRSLFEIENSEGLSVAIAVKVAVGVIKEDGLAVGREKLFL